MLYIPIILFLYYIGTYTTDNFDNNCIYTYKHYKRLPIGKYSSIPLLDICLIRDFMKIIKIKCT